MLKPPSWPRCGLLALAGLALMLTFGAPSAAQSLEAPTVRLVVAGESTLTVAWTAPTGVTETIEYDVRYIESSSTSKNDDAAWTVLRDVWAGGDLVAAVDGLTNGTAYDAAVRARTTSLTSGWSTAMAGTPSDPGSTVSTAAQVHSDVPLHAEIGSASDVDFYMFTVTEKSEYIIWTSGDTDTLGELTLSDGTSRSPRIAHNNWSIEPGPNNFMMFGDITPGSYFFKVTQGPQTATRTPLWQGTGYYTLHLSLTVDTTSRDDARTVTLGSKTAGVFIHPNRTDPNEPEVSDSDFFKLVLPTAATVSAHVELPPSDDRVQAKILDSAGTVVVPHQYGFLEPAGGQFALRAALVAGTYYIQLSMEQPYARHEPYFLYVNESPGATATRTAAAHLPFHTVAGGTATHDSDALLRFDLTADTAIELSGSSRVDEMAVELLDNAGDRLDISVYKDKITEGPRPVAERGQDFTLTPRVMLDPPVHAFLIREVLGAGTYFLNVKFETGGSTGEFLTLLHAEPGYARQLRQCPPGGIRVGGIPVGDPLHGCQWHLQNRGQFGGVSGQDINLGDAWATTRGEGVTVTVVDQGLDYRHADLRDNFALASSGSSFGVAAEELPKEASDHGTMVAGIIAARDNGVGVVGVAPRATLSAYQIFDPDNKESDMSGTIRALSLHAPQTSIRNHSWSPRNSVPKALPAAIESALDSSVADGDGGLGTLQIQSAGNSANRGGYTSYNQYLSHRSFAAVCGVDDRGDIYTYSNNGPNLWVCAPTYNTGRARIATTVPRNRYWPGFSGTSASAPMVSGVAALVRSANRDLSWRDTKLILADSARVVNNDDSSWADGSAKYSNPSQSYRYSHKFGFGVVDAAQAVALAQNWTLLPPEMSVEASESAQFEVQATQTTAVERSLQIDGPLSFVEHVEVEILMAALTFRNLEIDLVSPSGTTSKLSVPYRCSPLVQDCDVFEATVMSSTRHLGEDPRGTWKLRLTQDNGALALVDSWSLRIFGHTRAPVPSKASLSVSPKRVTEGGSLNYTITLDRAPGAGNQATVNFITVGGTATAGEDYTPVLRVGESAVSFGPAETSKEVTVHTLRGEVGHDEPPERLEARISRATLYVGADTQGTSFAMDPHTVSVTVDDHPDDAPDVWFEAASPGVVRNGQEAQFVARVSTPLESDVAVLYQAVRTSPSTSPDTSHSGLSGVRRADAADFTGTRTGTVTIPAGRTSAAFTVATTDDSDADYEFFRVRQRGGAPRGTKWRPAERGDTSADIVIEPDTAEGTIYLLAEPKAPLEGDTVRLSAHHAQGHGAPADTVIDIAATGTGGATADDFTLTDGALRISKGKQSSSNTARQSGAITIAADADYDPGETITLTGTSDQPTSKVLESTLAVTNTTPLTAELAFTDSSEEGSVAEGGSVGVTVSLGRALESSETVDVTLRLPDDAAGTILGDATLLSAGNAETGFSVASALAEVTRAHPETNRTVTYQEMTVRFAGAGARSGTLTLTLGDDGVVADPMLTVPLRISGVASTGLDEEAGPGARSILLIAVETEGLLIRPTALQITEGATATYQVSLRSDPGATVTVTVASDDEAAATVNKNSLTFTSAGADIWSTPQTVTVTAAADADGFDDVADITHAVAGYGDVAAGPRVIVAVRDDDIPNYTVPEDWALIPSGVSGGESFRLVVVTSETTAASSDHISFYNEFVERLVANGHTDIQGYAKGFRAWLSTADVDARDNTRTNRAVDGTGHRVHWLGGNKVADNNAGIYGGAGGWDASDGAHDETGAPVTASTTAWWGSAKDGTKRTGRHVAADAPSIRLTDVGNPTDGSRSNSGSESPHRVLAISPVFTVEIVHEITIEADHAHRTEGEIATFTVSAAPAPRSDLVVNLLVAESFGSDFLADELEGDREFTIPAGDSSATFTLPTASDADDEADASVRVSVADGDGYRPGSPNAASLKTYDDDATVVSLTGTSADVEEGAKTASFTVSIPRILAAGETLPVPLSITGTATRAIDYILRCGVASGITCQLIVGNSPTVTFTGPSAPSITVTLTSAASVTDRETAVIALGQLDSATGMNLRGGASADPNARKVIYTLRDVNPVSLSVSGGGDVAEGDAALTITATLTDINDSGSVASIPIRVSDTGTTANSGTDFTALAASIDIPDNSRSATASFTVLDDDTDEPPETVLVEIITDNLPQGITEGLSPSVEMTITDDDPTRVTLVVSEKGIAEAGGTKAITAHLGRGLVSPEVLPVTVRLDGTATAGTDWSVACPMTAPAGVTCDVSTNTAPVLTFTGGPSSAQSAALTLTATTDSDSDDGETVEVSLAALGASSGTELDGGAVGVGETTAFELSESPVDGPDVYVVAADSDLVPQGMGAGTSFRLLFVTSTDRDASSTSIDDYNSHAQGLVADGFEALRPYGALVKVVGSTASTAATANTATEWTTGGAQGVPVYWLKATPDSRVADHYEDFYDGSWDNVAGATEETGEAHTRVADGYWTGSTDGGAPHGTNPLGGTAAVFGDLSDTMSPLADGHAGSTATKRLLAMSPVLRMAGTAPLPAPPANSLGSYTVPHDWELKPDGLNPGDEFRLVFLTSTHRDATSTDIAHYDTHVRNVVANNGHDSILPYASLVKVVGSTAAVDAREHTLMNPDKASHVDAPVYWLNGPRVASGRSGFWSSTWENWAREDRRIETGEPETGADWPWTGTDEDGRKASANALGAAQVRRGVFMTATEPTGPIASRWNSGNSQSHSLYGISPRFRVGNPPDYSLTLSWTPAGATYIDEGRSSYQGGSDIGVSFTLNNAAPAGGIDLGLVPAPDETDRFEVMGAGTDVKVASGQTTVSYRVSSIDNSDDEPDYSIAYTYRNDPGFDSLTPADGTISLTVRDDDPTMVSLSGVDSSATEGQRIQFNVELARALVAAETIVVPLAITGDADPATDFTVMKKSGADNTGVTLDTATPAAPKVAFSGEGAQTATLELALRKDAVGESGFETITVALGSGDNFDAESGTNVGGGADPQLQPDSVNPAQVSTQRFSVRVADAPFVQFRTCEGTVSGDSCPTGWVETGPDDPPPTITLMEGGPTVTYQWRAVDPHNRRHYYVADQVTEPRSHFGGYIGAGGPDRDRLICHTGRSRGHNIGDPIVYVPHSPDGTNIGYGSTAGPLLDRHDGCPFASQFIYEHDTSKWRPVTVAAGQDSDAFDHNTFLVHSPHTVGHNFYENGVLYQVGGFDYPEAHVPLVIVDDDEWEQDLVFSDDDGATWTSLQDGGLALAFPPSLNTGDRAHKFMVRLKHDPSTLGSRASESKRLSLYAWEPPGSGISPGTIDEHRAHRVTFSTNASDGKTSIRSGISHAISIAVEHSPTTVWIDVGDRIVGSVRFAAESYLLYERWDNQISTATPPARVRTKSFSFYRQVGSCVGCQRPRGDLPDPVVERVGELAYANLSDTGIDLSWQRVMGAEGYEVRYWSTTSPFADDPDVPEHRPEDVYTGVEPEDPAWNIRHLEPETEYRAVVYYQYHGATQLSTASPVLRFSTLSAGAPVDAEPTSVIVERVPEVSISAAGGTITEGEDAVFTVTVDPAPDAPLDVNIHVVTPAARSVVAGAQLGTRTANVPTSGSATFTIPTTDDAHWDSNGMLGAKVEFGDGYRPRKFGSYASVYIRNNDLPPPPAVQLKRVSDTTATIAWRPQADGTQYTVGWHKAYSGIPVLQEVTTTDSEYQIAGLAPETRYAAYVLAGTVQQGQIKLLTLAAGQQAQTFQVDFETPTPNMSLPVISVTVGGGVTEGGTASFTLTASPAPSANLAVSVTVSQSGDYGATTGQRSVTVPASGSVTFTVGTTDDQADEADGSVTATVNAGSDYTVSATQGTATVSVADNDDAPVVSITGGSGVTEGGSASFTISANPAPTADLDVTVTVTASGDYGVTAGSQTVTIPTSGAATLTIATTDDSNDEADGSVTATINTGSGYTGSGSATVAVSDDDPPVVVDQDESVLVACVTHPTLLISSPTASRSDATVDFEVSLDCIPNTSPVILLIPVRDGEIGENMFVALSAEQTTATVTVTIGGEDKLGLALAWSTGLANREAQGAVTFTD